jgi:hypothetical protein
MNQGQIASITISVPSTRTQERIVMRKSALMALGEDDEARLKNPRGLADQPAQAIVNVSRAVRRRREKLEAGKPIITTTSEPI